MYAACDITLGLLLTRCTNLVWKGCQFDIRLPRTMFTAAPANFVNPDFANLYKSKASAANGGRQFVEGEKEDEEARITFTPIKNARSMKECLIPNKFVKKKTIPLLDEEDVKSKRVVAKKKKKRVGSSSSSSSSSSCQTSPEKSAVTSPRKIELSSPLSRESPTSSFPKTNIDLRSRKRLYPSPTCNTTVESHPIDSSSEFSKDCRVVIDFLSQENISQKSKSSSSAVLRYPTRSRVQKNLNS